MSEITNYLSPCSLDDAVNAMAGGDVTVLCGGTDLTVQTEVGQKEYASTLMNIRCIEGLAEISLADNTCRIGALATVTDIMTNELLNALTPVLIETADQFASDQIRNAASIGGNICNASPAGDMIIPLLLMNAAVELASWQDDAVQTRLVLLDEFFTAPGKTVKQENELLTAVVFAKPPPGFVARFRKTGPRPALEIATVSIGIGGVLEEGVLSDVRAAMGAVAPTPIRARRVESALEGRPLNADSIKAAAGAGADEDATPIDDIRASAWYRDHLVRVLTEEALNHVLENGD
jgi:CO/xanthine dehydrogenase FAD-binding subunit|tara:strand:- start:2039 stop:2914 length:876 start_codon:yes stop_codon:yes gene_type:complete